jgi:hypothetical protein
MCAIGAVDDVCVGFSGAEMPVESVCRVAVAYRGEGKRKGGLRGRGRPYGSNGVGGRGGRG